MRGRYFKEGHSRQREQTLNEGIESWKSGPSQARRRGQLKESVVKSGDGPASPRRPVYDRLCVMAKAYGFYLKGSRLLLKTLS